ncbi:MULTISPECIES: DUF397 domain-containing protein [Herbidospora]|uniref:DUF397 domain-containing protein n=1 Tax=Herbidospora TaxID=28443 RepID=UPI0024A2D669|nr:MULTISPECIES: DUF397 domain-containing protein [Herbidospora]GLX98279.1 hypothetical protein Hesp01_62290 [Herbidospora sp. NBRC 101105]
MKFTDLDVSAATWRKAEKSNSQGDQCVEVALMGHAIALRDSKNPTGPILAFTPAEWDAFVHGVKGGEFDV